MLYVESDPGFNPNWSLETGLLTLPSAINKYQLTIPISNIVSDGVVSYRSSTGRVLYSNILKPNQPKITKVGITDLNLNSVSVLDPRFDYILSVITSELNIVNTFQILDVNGNLLYKIR
jgi:hypothetical protein